MSKTKFTPGPWQYAANTVYKLNEGRVNHFWLNVSATSNGASEIEQEANAALIAAAPEMYQEIEGDIKRIEAQMMFKTDADETLPGLIDLRDRKLALLARARGES